MSRGVPASSEHRPKISALLAYSEGLLSDAGTARVARHLEACATCRRELAAMEAYEQVLEEARALPVPEVDFDRMELALRREATKVAAEARGARRGWLPFAALAAAAAALLALYATWPEPTPREAAPATPTRAPAQETPTPPVELARLQPVVTLVTGPVQHRVAGREPATSLALSSSLREGDSLETGPGGTAHVRLAVGTGIVLAEGSRLTLTRARQGDAELTLAAGAVSQEVAPLADGARYVVRAGAYEVAVRGTRFEVGIEGEAVRVELAEGRVEVRGAEGLVATLSAPARWRSDGAVPPDDLPEVAAPRGLDGLALTALTLSHPEVVRWELDGTEIASPATVHLAVREGELPVRGWTAAGRQLEATLQVGRQPMVIDEGVLAQSAPRIRAGHLETEVIRQVVQRGQRNLTRCYETSLRRGGAPVGRVHLRVTVGPMGDVTRVAVRELAGAGADELRTCLSNYVERWTFPAPGGQVSFDVPLTLAPTMR